jgi:hypothetical protein
MIVTFFLAQLLESGIGIGVGFEWGDRGGGQNQGAVLP